MRKLKRMKYTPAAHRAARDFTGWRARRQAFRAWCARHLTSF